MVKDFRSIFALLGVIVVIFLLFPVIDLFKISGLSALKDAISDKTVVNSVILTIKISFFSTVFILLFGVPLAYLLARYNFFLKPVVEGIVDLPTMIPHIAAGIALLVVFGSKGLLGKFFYTFSIKFLDTQWGIFAAMSFVSAPYLINAAKESFKKIDPRLEYVSETLGITPFETFLKITLPLAKKDIINGALMMWGRGIGEFGAVVVLAYYPMTTPVLIYDRFTSYGLKYAMGAAVLLITISLLIFVSVRFLSRK
ncbi:ABC transporter permease [Hippea jasoniae]|uniref:ABC transporter permease n=1 Tax=Hippea jasoniae TaxID=944479 RepID=UPI00054F4B29|nr:ABC transporter permease [Hippea jasoniae]